METGDHSDKADAKTRLQEQIAQLQRLADEAQSCAELLRMEAERYQRALSDDSVSDEELDRLMTERAELIPDLSKFKVTDRLM